MMRAAFLAVLAGLTLVPGVRGDDEGLPPWLAVTRWRGEFTITVNGREETDLRNLAPGAKSFHEASWAIQGSFTLDLPRGEDGRRYGPAPGQTCAGWDGHARASAAMSGDYGVQPGPGIRTGYVVSDSVSPRGDDEGKHNRVRFAVETEDGTFDFGVSQEFAGRLVADSSEAREKIRAAVEQAKGEGKELLRLLEALAEASMPEDSQPFTCLVAADVDDFPLPEKPGVVSGSKKMRFHLPEVLGPTVEGTFAFSLSPVTEGPTVEIVKVEQAGGTRTTDPRQVVFEGGALVIVAEAEVDPPELAAAVTWEAPDLDEVKGKVASRVLENGHVEATVTYSALPAANSGFGSRTLRALAGDDEAQGNFSVFFSRDGRDSPEAPAAGGAKAPNWYVYWKQGPVPDLERFEFVADASMGAGYQPKSGRLTVTGSAPGVIPALDVNLVTKDEAHSYRLTRERREGIQAVAACVLHELKHKELHETKGDDYDEDAVTDAVETESADPWLDVFQPNTYANFAVELFYGDTEAWVAGGEDEDEQAARKETVSTHRGQLRVKGDNELLAIIAERDAAADESSDWAFPGSQAQAPQR